MRGQDSDWLDDYSEEVAWQFWYWVADAGWFDLWRDSEAFAFWIRANDEHGPPPEVIAEVDDTLQRLDAEYDLRKKFTEWGVEEDEILDYLLFVLEGAYYQVDPTQPHWRTMPDEVLWWMEVEGPDYGEPEATMEFMQAFADQYREDWL